MPIVSVPSRRKKKNGPPKYKWKKERKIRVILVYDSVIEELFWRACFISLQKVVKSTVKK